MGGLMRSTLPTELPDRERPAFVHAHLLILTKRYFMTLPMITADAAASAQMSVAMPPPILSLVENLGCSMPIVPTATP